MEWTGQFVRWFEKPGWSLPSDTTGAPQPTPFTATWQSPERSAMKKLYSIIRFFSGATPLVALAALVIGVIAHFRPTPTEQDVLQNRIANLQNLFEQRLEHVQPETIHNPIWLNTSIKNYVEWERNWHRFATAYQNFGDLTDGPYNYAPHYVSHVNSMARRKKLQLQNIAAQAIKPPTPTSQIISSVDEVIQLAHTLNEIGWDKDVNLAALLEERAKHEETANPDDARKLRELSQDLAKTMHTPPQSTATSST
ncbi:MAG: hypothetical protein BroJett014_11240 [Planctomycetota bacterium]|nr:hypothetical protein [Planctomycetota bacterium]GIK52151.1 MAG: hypothetical protein BroJett014_11240 [Planctomycetota bacterium]